MAQQSNSYDFAPHHMAGMSSLTAPRATVVDRRDLQYASHVNFVDQPGLRSCSFGAIIFNGSMLLLGIGVMIASIILLEDYGYIEELLEEVGLANKFLASVILSLLAGTFGVSFSIWGMIVVVVKRGYWLWFIGLVFLIAFHIATVVQISSWNGSSPSTDGLDISYWNETIYVDPGYACLVEYDTPCAGFEDGDCKGSVCATPQQWYNYSTGVYNGGYNCSAHVLHIELCPGMSGKFIESKNDSWSGDDQARYNSCINAEMKEDQGCNKAIFDPLETTLTVIFGLNLALIVVESTGLLLIAALKCIRFGK